MGQLVQSRFVRSPVVGTGPVLDQLPQVVDRDPVLPARVLDLVGEAGPDQSLVQIGEDRIVDPNLECLDRVCSSLVWMASAAVAQRGSQTS